MKYSVAPGAPGVDAAAGVGLQQARQRAKEDVDVVGLQADIRAAAVPFPIGQDLGIPAHQINSEIAQAQAGEAGRGRGVTRCILQNA